MQGQALVPDVEAAAAVLMGEVEVPSSLVERVLAEASLVLEIAQLERMMGLLVL